MGTGLAGKRLKAVSKTSLMSQLPVKLQEQKVFTFSKNNSFEVGFQNSYASTTTFNKVLKGKQGYRTGTKAKIIPKTNNIKPAKRKDVQRLTDFFPISHEEISSFYDDVLPSTAKGKDEDDERIFDEIDFEL